MSDRLLTGREIARQGDGAQKTGPDLAANSVDSSRSEEIFDALEAELDLAPDRAAHADRRSVRSKLAAGWRGLKVAARGDSSFFAHFYRGTLIALAAALLGINQWSWCLIILGAALVLTAELGHSAVDTLARAIGDPEEPRLRTAREIAAAGVLIAALGSGSVTILVLSWKFFELLNWRL